MFGFEQFVDVEGAGGSWGRRTDAEAETVGLVDVVVGVLAEDYDFHGVERSVAGPGKSGKLYIFGYGEARLGIDVVR